MKYPIIGAALLIASPFLWYGGVVLLNIFWRR
jgi:hypothetical protein